MKDHELRAAVLQKYYDLRHRGFFHWDETIEVEDTFPIKTFSELARMSKQLADYNLIEWRPTLGNQGEPVAGGGEITAFGCDVIEGTAKSPITITFDQRHAVTITGSNNIVGDNNSIHADEISNAIIRSSFSEAEKAEAKSLWQKVCDNKLLNTVVGSVFGAATKHALETTVPLK